MIKKHSLFFIILCVSLNNITSDDSFQVTESRRKYLESRNLKQLEEILKNSEQSIAMLTISLQQEQSWQKENENSEYQSPYEDEYNDYITKMKQDLNRLENEKNIISKKIEEIRSKLNKKSQPESNQKSTKIQRSSNPISTFSTQEENYNIPHRKNYDTIISQQSESFDPYSTEASLTGSLENNHPYSSNNPNTATPREESENDFNRTNTMIPQNTSSSTAYSTNFSPSTSTKTTPHKTPNTSSHIITNPDETSDELQQILPIKPPLPFPNK